MNCEITGKRIAELRKKKGWTQKDLAETVHVSIAAVSKWERGLNFPDLSLLEELAHSLDTSVSALLDLETANQEEIIRDMTQLSEQEKNSMKIMLIHRMLLILGLGFFFLFFIVAVGLFGSRASLHSGILTILSPLLLGLISWFLAGAGIISGRKVDTDHWKHCSCASFLFSAVALYFPLYILDADARRNDISALLDTVWGFHFGAIVLLTGTLLLNGCSWWLNRKRENL